MDKNIKHAHDLDAEAAAQLNRFKDQLIIMLVKRLGGVVDISIDESNGTGNDILLMESDPIKGFHFEIQKKTKKEKTAIALESWKLSIFKKELENAGFKFEKKAGIIKDTLTLMVETNDLYKLQEVIKAANKKAAKSKMN